MSCDFKVLVQRSLISSFSVIECPVFSKTNIILFDQCIIVSYDIFGECYIVHILNILLVSFCLHSVKYHKKIPIPSQEYNRDVKLC